MVSERQKVKLFHEAAVSKFEQILDVWLCVDKLHGCSAETLRKSITRLPGGAGYTIGVPRGPYKVPAKVNVEALLKALPLHLLACLCFQQPAPDATGGEPPKLSECKVAAQTPLAYLLQGLQLLAQLCLLAPHLSHLIHVVQGEEFQARVVDVAVMTLLAVAGPEANDCIRLASAPDGGFEALERAKLVPAALHLLIHLLQPANDTAADLDSAPSPESFAALCEGVLGHPTAPVFLDVVFDAIRTLLRMVRAALTSSAGGDSGGFKDEWEPEGRQSPACGDGRGGRVDTWQLAFQAGVSMEVLAELCAMPLFYQSLLLHDPHGSAPLRLILVGLLLHDPPLCPPPCGWREGVRQPVPPHLHSTASGRGSAELLAARCMALLTMLSEAELPAFLDQVSASPATQPDAAQASARLCSHAEVLFQRQVLHEPLPTAPGEAQMALNTLRGLEVLADDSNFRQAVMQRLAAPLAQALSLEPQQFEARWCAGAEAVSAHLSDELQIMSVTHESLHHAAKLSQAASEYVQVGSAAGREEAQRLIPARQAALERAILLFKILGNLHFFAPANCEAHLEDFFLKLLLADLGGIGPWALNAVVGNLDALTTLMAKLFSSPLNTSDPGDDGSGDLVARKELELVRDLIEKLSVAGAIDGQLAALPSRTASPARDADPIKILGHSREGQQTLGQGQQHVPHRPQTQVGPSPGAKARAGILRSLPGRSDDDAMQE